MEWPRISIVLEDTKEEEEVGKKWKRKEDTGDFSPTDLYNKNNTRRHFATVICVEPYSTVFCSFISLVWLVWLFILCSFLICQSDSFPSFWDKNLSAILFMTNALCLWCPTKVHATFSFGFAISVIMYHVKLETTCWYYPPGYWVHCCWVLGNVCAIIV